ncbi:MAG: hypothetical protein U5K33_06675 [Halofilum sp. (in: g-proteobacteria)]|nr:hypothetical protein [Halofilum sp. (in: g-proteobacteria)]
MSIVAHRVEDWPPLAWLAWVTRGDSRRMELFHGNGVEVRADWFFEGAWDGAFAAGGFDTTDIVAGTGARVRDDGIRFVSYGNTLNRLHYRDSDGGAIVSNSLPCLLAATGLRPRIGYTRYQRDLFSIVRGLKRYRRQLPLDDGHVSLLYYENLLWDGQAATVENKPRPDRDFTTYADYRAFLDGALERLLSNAEDADRGLRYRPLGTLSGGYDSPAVMALARGHGCTEALHLEPARRTVDSAAPEIAAHLGVTLHRVPVDAWRERGGRPEPLYIAGVPDAEDIRFESAGDALHGRLLIMGAWGDVCWNPHHEGNPDDFTRTDTQGLSLTEARLWRSYQVLAVPMLAGLQVRDIQALGRSPEMRPWRIGGAYDRPVPRRMTEEAGVPRGAFAQSKIGQSPAMQSGLRFLEGESVEQFTQWLHANADALPRFLGLKPDPAHDAFFFRLGRPLRLTAARLPWAWRLNRTWKTHAPSRRFAFQWALETVASHYRDALPRREVRESLSDRPPGRVTAPDRAVPNRTVGREPKGG